MQEITSQEYKQEIGKTISIAEKKFKLEKPKISVLNPKNFDIETTSVYSFPKRGNWATHYLNAAYRGNFAPEIARNMILRYSEKGEKVLDPFCGSGTTLIEAKTLGRKAIGLDINRNAALLTLNRLDFEKSRGLNVFVGDAQNMEKVSNDDIDLIVAHPPYADIIKYSNQKNDLSNLNIDEFIQAMEKVSKECYRVLKPNRFCALLIGDSRKNGFYKPIAFKVMEKFLEAGFLLKEDIIKAQWNCSKTGFWKTMAKKHNFHLIMHEHLFVFKKSD